MKATLAVLAAALVAAGACRTSADGPPPLDLDRTRCSQCGMLISEAAFAAASRTTSGETRVFDDIGCLRKAHIGSHTKSTQFWFHDVRDRSWIDGRQAVFVEAESLHTPMAGGYVAFRERAAADTEARSRQGRVIVSLDLLFTDQGGGR